MKQAYIVKKKEQYRMNAILYKKNDRLNAIFNHLPDYIIQHSYRVAQVARILAKYVPEERLPNGLDPSSYRAALFKAGYYHEIGIYRARNDIERRPIAAEKELNDHMQTECLSPESRDVIFETVRGCRERYDGQGYPHALEYDAIPLHANICAIADSVDMIMGDGRVKKRNAKKVVDYISKNSGILFRPDAVRCFEQAQNDVFEAY
ncbi:MAG: HD domain-containing protein [Oscillospiraceae bacterium]|nr:HD domain-containing protein [Oscillospiraceae bacterium]